MWVLGIKLGPLQEQQVLLTTNSPLQPLWIMTLAGSLESKIILELACLAEAYLSTVGHDSTNTRPACFAYHSLWALPCAQCMAWYATIAPSQMN